MKQKVVILIFTHKSEPSEFERLSFGQCFKILGSHPIRLVCPKGLDISAYEAIAPNLIADFIDPKWFCSLRDYNLLKVLPWLYRRYSKYEFMLTYELDAYVFRDELHYWCDQGWDYIGAPWFEDFHECKPDSPIFAVGNSGFSLRRISAIRRVFHLIWLANIKKLILRMVKLSVGLKTIVKQLSLKRQIITNFDLHYAAEDQFWCFYAGSYERAFRIAPCNIAKRFAFEANPQLLFGECGRILPFGCHKPLIFGPEFWKSYIS